MNNKEAYCEATMLGKLLNLSERRIQQLAQAGILQKVGRNQYDLVTSIQNYVAYLQKQTKKSQPSYKQLKINHQQQMKQKTDLEIIKLEYQLKYLKDLPVYFQDLKELLCQSLNCQNKI